MSMTPAVFRKGLLNPSGVQVVLFQEGLEADFYLHDLDSFTFFFAARK